MSERRHWSELEMEEKLCYYQWIDTLLEFGILPEMSIDERYAKIRRMYECDAGRNDLHIKDIWEQLDMPAPKRNKKPY